MSNPEELQRRDVGRDSLISVVAPVYNEEKILDTFVEEVLTALEALSLEGRYELVLINDGSTDGSAERMDRWAERRPGVVRCLHLSRNFGHDAAVTAGLQTARGDAVILMDSDLQDDPAAFQPFVEKWLQGYHVVYAQRVRRKENPLLRVMFWGFYRLLGAMANFRLPLHAGNFSLMDRTVVDRLLQLGERNRYLPGLRAWIGFSQTGVPVERRKRHDSKTRVGFRGKWTLAMNAIFSFSYVPIFAFRAIGVLSLLLSAVLFIIALFGGLYGDYGMSGLLSPVIWIAFFAGINLFGISVIGEYVARIYDEVKNRPQFIIERLVDHSPADDDDDA